MHATEYDERYRAQGYYWGTVPSRMCYRVLELCPPVRPLKILDVGCGEGRDAVFFARNGYHVTAFDLSEMGVRKTLDLAREAGVRVDAFRADLLTHRLTSSFDIIFCNGVLHFVPSDMRAEILENYRGFTNPGGLNVLGVFVRKPFIPPAPDSEPGTQPWLSGEVFTYYHDWRLELCAEEIFDCMSSGVAHQHAMNRMIARKP